MSKMSLTGLILVWAGLFLSGNSRGELFLAISSF